MTRLYRPVLVLVVIILIILGLNTSNQGTNSLTSEERKPVIGLKIEKQNINVFALGEQYTYTRQDLAKLGSSGVQDIKGMLTSFSDYLKKIWTIFRVIFLK